MKKTLSKRTVRFTDVTIEKVDDETMKSVFEEIKNREQRQKADSREPESKDMHQNEKWHWISQEG